MAKLVFDAAGAKLFEAGVYDCVLFKGSKYGSNASTGVAWNGITNITQSPSGGESNKQYADNIPYADLRSAEEFGGTINAFTYPDVFEECQGNVALGGLVRMGQQTKEPFAIAYKTKIGNDVDGLDHGFKLHIIYGCTVNPTERSYDTINDSPEAMEMSWEFTTLPVKFTYNNKDYTASSFEVSIVGTAGTNAQALLDSIYGSDTGTSTLPSPETIMGYTAA